MGFRYAAVIICFAITSSLRYGACQLQADCDSCCKTHRKINEPRRSANSVWKSGQMPLCDRDFQRGWYRFTSFVGQKMPERRVPINHCGTQAPIWLDGVHPTKPGENVVRKACINVFELSNGCYEALYINITNCGDHFVYYLRPPWYCAAAYCAGESDILF